MVGTKHYEKQWRLKLKNNVAEIRAFNTAKIAIIRYYVNGYK